MSQSNNKKDNIGHNSNRSISQETYEKLANRFMHIIEVVNNNLTQLEKRYWEAFTKYPYQSKYDHCGSHKKLREHEVHEQKISADKQLLKLKKELYAEEDKLSEQLMTKYGISVMSERQESNKRIEEEIAAEEGKDNE
ncbi:hypothetical protein [Candidatus Pelagibacter sp. HIMB1710]